jgi:hypothetical protein
MHSKGKIKRRAFVICATLLILYFLPLAGLWPWQIWHGWCSVAIESECQDLDVANPSPSLAAVLQKLQKTPQLKLEKVGLLTHDVERHFTFTGKKDRTHQTIFLCSYEISDLETRAAVERWQLHSRPRQNMRTLSKADFPDWWPEQGVMYLLSLPEGAELYWLKPGDTSRFYRLINQGSDGELIMD